MQCVCPIIYRLNYLQMASGTAITVQVEHGKARSGTASLWLQGHLSPFVKEMCAYHEGDTCSVRDLPLHTNERILLDWKNLAYMVFNMCKVLC